MRILLVVFALAACSPAPPPPAKAAYAACWRAIVARLEAEPGTEILDAGPGKNNADRPEFYFNWPSGALYNARPRAGGLGASAACLGRLDTRRLEWLSINGRDEVLSAAEASF